MSELPIADWIARVRTAEKCGDLVLAYELATQGLASYPDNVDLRYLATRLLARSGATMQAAASYRQFELDRRDELDIAALGARIAKDHALTVAKDRRSALRAAAALYAGIYTRTHDQYPAINAATLYLLAGDHKKARLYAQHALDAGAHASAENSLDRYYRAVTHAEAALIQEDTDAARLALQEAAGYLGGDFDAAATTRKQLRLVCHATGADPDLLDVIRPPAVLHYHGLAIANRSLPWLDQRTGRAFTAQIADHLASLKIGYAYGSLTAGGEILCAEACLSAGVELNVVLPFNSAEFIATAVRSAGPQWVARYEDCLRRAKSVTFATTDSYQGDNELFSYACRLTMGMSLLRARQLDTAAVHFNCQAGADPDPRGYAENLRLWHSLAQSIPSAKPGELSRAIQIDKTRRRTNRPPPRVSRALVFGDVKGFSRIPDPLIPVFQKQMMGAIAGVLRRYRGHVLYRNSWGDAIYIVLDDPVIAAKCCLAIQDAMTKSDPGRLGLSTELALRLAAHFGPVYDGRDPIRGEPMFFGHHTTITARMEPVTPPGHVYVTEAMAAAIAMANASRLRVEYVGNVEMAKGFGATRMYCLNHARHDTPAASAGAVGSSRTRSQTKE